MKKAKLSKKILFIGILSCGYIAYFLYMYTLIIDFIHMLNIDLIVRFSIATILLIIFHMFVSEVFKDYKEVDSTFIYNQYYNHVIQSYNTVFKITSDLIHNKLTKYELECNIVSLKKQRDFLMKVDIPKEFQQNHVEIISYINEILNTLT